MSLQLEQRALSQASNTLICRRTHSLLQRWNISCQGTYYFEVIVCIEPGVPMVDRQCGPLWLPAHWACSFIQFPGQAPHLTITSSLLGITLDPLCSSIIHANNNSNKQIVSLTTLLKHTLPQFYQLIGLCLAFPPLAISVTMPDSLWTGALFTASHEPCPLHASLYLG